MPGRNRIGLLVPSNNSTVEPDFNLAVPPSASVHSHHLWTDIDPRRPARSDKMGDEFLQATRFLTPMKLGVLCLPQGNAASEDQFTRIFELPTVASSPSVLQALRHFKVEKLVLITPYDEYVNTRVWEFFRNFRLEVLGAFGDPAMTASSQQDTNLQDPEAIIDFALSVCPSDADAIVLSGSAWRAMEAAAEIEQRTGKIVITTNQATVWRALRRMGETTARPGYGRLLDEMPPTEDELSIQTQASAPSRPAQASAR